MQLRWKWTYVFISVKLYPVNFCQVNNKNLWVFQAPLSPYVLSKLESLELPGEFKVKYF